MFNRKIKIIILSLIVMITIPSITEFLKGEPEGISYEEEFDNITITTEYITLKINDLSPHFIWLNSDNTPAVEMYNVKFISIKEFFGENDILDNPMELGGISYDLSSNDWDHEITINSNSLSVKLTLSDLANGAEIQFIISIYNEDKIISGSDHSIDALTEIKIDIIISNWDFSENAAGLALFTLVYESQENPAVQIRDGLEVENGNASTTMQFESENYNNNKIAYFEWTTFADIYDGPDLTDNINVSKASLVDDFTSSLPVSPAMIPIYLTYPNYGNSLKMIHDPSIGVYPENYSVTVNALSIINGIMLIITIALVGLHKRASNKNKFLT